MEPTYVSTKLRCFSGVIGLYYSDQSERKSWTLDDVKSLIKSWIEQRACNRQVNLCVVVSNTESLFYHNGGTVVEEPCVRVYGEIVRPNASIVDDKIKEALLSLFSFLKVELKQYSVRFHFQGYSGNESIRVF
jgi:hypothetical protein